MGCSFYIRSEAEMSNCQYMMQVKSTEDAKICFSISFEDHVSPGNVARDALLALYCMMFIYALL